MYIQFIEFKMNFCGFEKPFIIIIIIFVNCFVKMLEVMNIMQIMSHDKHQAVDDALYFV